MPRRVALYSHDALGLGHLRRNVAIAGALVAASPDTDVLLLNGSPDAARLDLPPRTDVLTLPSVCKTGRGEYAGRRLDLPLNVLLDLRGRTLDAALCAFEPDLVIVDKHPRGFGGELDRSLAMLRSSTDAAVVLGVRDVLDDAATTRREWAQDRLLDVVRASYDAVWVYGDPDVYDVVADGALPPGVAGLVSYTGYLGHGRHAGGRRGPAADLTGGRPYVLCLVGGGQDGAALAAAAVAAAPPAGHDVVVVTGPQMAARQREALLAAAQDRGQPGGARAHVLGYVPDAEALASGAAAVVSMCGYNSACELLASGTPTLFVPRTAPRVEQLIRARRLAAVGAADLLEPAGATPGALGAWLAQAVRRASRPAPRVDLDGLSRLPVLAAGVAADTAGRVARRSRAAELVDAV